MKIILPNYFCEVNELEINCENLEGLKIRLKEENEQILNLLFDNYGNINNNVIFAMNGKVVKKEMYSSLEFQKDSILEVLVQFAGG